VRAILSPPNALSDRKMATPTSLPLPSHLDRSVLSPSLFYQNTAFHVYMVILVALISIKETF